MSKYTDVLKFIKDNDVKYVDFRFTDMKGKWQHTAYIADMVDEELLKDGVMFDGSSISGWQAINNSDMLLMPDPKSLVMDPFAAQPTAILVCDVIDPGTNDRYGRDPRSIAERAQDYLKSTGIGDTAYFGPEPEFFIFDDVRYENQMHRASYSLDSEEGPYNSGRDYEHGNTGHRPGVKGGYFPVAPIDSAQDIRCEMLSTMAAMGITVEKHHHEVAPSQHEVGFKYDTLLKTADNVQIMKYVVHNVAHLYGKTATFMPKPIKGDNGSGMHIHQSIWKDGKNVFSGDKYDGLSQECLWFIGGVIKHARVINAFSNPTTNSYKRLIPGFEAPVLLAYSSRNRSASIRIPHVSSPKAKRIEVRFPDPACNPYLTMAALLMAGLDGIQNKIDPGKSSDKNLYELPKEELATIPTVCGSLREALIALENDHDFLIKGDVFSKGMIESYLEIKWAEVYALEHTPHPIEFSMYYSV